MLVCNCKRMTGRYFTPIDRAAKRKPFNYEARIANPAGGLPVVIVDISAGGARLDTPMASTVPDAFTLMLTPDGKITRKCRVAWRSPISVGVSFTR